MKKFKSVLVFLLSLIIVFSAFPSTVFAKDIVVNQSFKYNIQLRDSQDSIQNLKGTSNSVPFSKGYDLPQSNLVNIVLDFDTNLYNFDDNDDVVITLQLNDRFESISSAVCHYRGSQEGGNPRGVFNPDNNTLTFNVHIYPPATNDYTFSFNLSGITSKEKYKNVPFLFELKSFKLSITSETQTFMERVKDFFSELSERLTSWFDSLFQWLKDIRDGNISFSESVKTLFSNITNSIKGFFSELGTKLSNGFTNLTNSIRDFFTNLGNNLKDWFDDVGQWFTDIGDRIGQFFTDIWNNISDSISSITNAVSDWWQSVKDFFHSLFVPEDGYFDSYKLNWENWAREHFALFFDVEDIFDILFNFFEGDAVEPGIVIPEIKLPFFNNPVIVPQTTFYFRQLLNQHAMLKRIFDLFHIVFSAIVYGFLLFYLQKTFSKILTDDEEAL